VKRVTYGGSQCSCQFAAGIRQLGKRRLRLFIAQFNGDSPAGLIADAFFTKGEYAPEELFRKIADLVAQIPLRPASAKPDKSASLDSAQRHWIFRGYLY